MSWSGGLSEALVGLERTVKAFEFEGMQEVDWMRSCSFLRVSQDIKVLNACRIVGGVSDFLGGPACLNNGRSATSENPWRRPAACCKKTLLFCSLSEALRAKFR